LNPNPIFIVGAPRSGTTLMQFLLNAHSRIAIAPETDFYPKVRDTFARGMPDLWEDAVTGFLNSCQQSFKPSVDLSNARASLLMCQPGDWASLFSIPIQAWAAAQGTYRWGEKTPRHLFYSDVFMSDFPSASVIEIVRDPRGCVSSMQRAPFFADSIAINALNCREYMSSGRQRLLETVPADQLLTVHYEELLSAPADSLRGIFSFLEESFEPDVLDYWKTATDYMLEPNSRLLTQPLDRNNVERWRTELSGGEIAAIEFLVRAPMRSCGYIPERHRPTAAQALRTVFDASYWLIKRWQHREERSHIIHYRPLASLDRRRMFRLQRNRQRR
jgi:hypothetical protein